MCFNFINGNLNSTSGIIVEDQNKSITYSKFGKLVIVSGYLTIHPGDALKTGETLATLPYVALKTSYATMNRYLIGSGPFQGICIYAVNEGNRLLINGNYSFDSESYYAISFPYITK